MPAGTINLSTRVMQSPVLCFSFSQQQLNGRERGDCSPDNSPVLNCTFPSLSLRSCLQQQIPNHSYLPHQAAGRMRQCLCGALKLTCTMQLSSFNYCNLSSYSYSSKFREQLGVCIYSGFNTCILLYANAELTPQDANPLPEASNAQKSTELQHIFHSPH